MFKFNETHYSDELYKKILDAINDANSNLSGLSYVTNRKNEPIIRVKKILSKCTNKIMFQVLDQTNQNIKFKLFDGSKRFERKQYDNLNKREFINKRLAVDFVDCERVS